MVYVFGSVWDRYLSKSRNYSDFSRLMNRDTNGWYNTVANALPYVSNVHNALLGHDEQQDYVDQNGITWDKVQGYNANKINFGISNNLSALSSSGTYLQNIASDLGKLYSGQQQNPQTSLDKWFK